MTNQITEDLAVVGRASRARPLPLETTLRAVGLLAPVPASTGSSLAFVTLARVFATRVARIASGGAALAAIAVMSAMLCFGRHDTDEWGVVDEMLAVGKLWTWAIMLGLVGLAYAIGSTLALRGFERSLGRARDPHAAAHRLVRVVDRWSTAAAIIGPAALITTVGITYFALGDHSFHAMFRDGNMASHGALMLALISGASVAIIVGSVVVARRPPRSSRWWIPAGLVLGTATLLVGFRVDVGPHAYALIRLPSVPLRIALTTSSTLAVFLVIGGWVLFARRRDSLATRPE